MWSWKWPIVSMVLLILLSWSANSAIKPPIFQISFHNNPNFIISSVNPPNCLTMKLTKNVEFTTLPAKGHLYLSFEFPSPSSTNPGDTKWVLFYIMLFHCISGQLFNVLERRNPNIQYSYLGREALVHPLLMPNQFW